MRELVRRNIGRRLAEYYAQPANSVVGRSAGTESLELSTLWGQWQWRLLLARLYKEREGHWLTPVELFQPHFSYILGDFCLSAVQTSPRQGNDPSLEIVELGGGRGTNARHILDYLRTTNPEIYNGLRYTLVDASPTLHQFQRNLFMDSDHRDRISFQCLDLMNVAEQSMPLLSESDVPTVVLGMEVLDNLPHDKVHAKTRNRIMQAEIIHKGLSGDYDDNHGTNSEETFVPLHDPLLSKILDRVPSYVATRYPTWIPSSACGVLEHLIHQRPNLGLIFADFDWLPPPDLIQNEKKNHNKNKNNDDKDADKENHPPILGRRTKWAEGEPLITDMLGNDHECFLQAPKHCDILFPTDFDKLGLFAKNVLTSQNHRGNVIVEKQANFLDRYGPRHVQNTKSWLTGFTPLLHDYVNCSVLTITTTDSGPVESSSPSRENKIE